MIKREDRLVGGQSVSFSPIGQYQYSRSKFGKFGCNICHINYFITSFITCIFILTESDLRRNEVS